MRRESVAERFVSLHVDSATSKAFMPRVTKLSQMSNLLQNICHAVILTFCLPLETWSMVLGTIL